MKIDYEKIVADYKAAYKRANGKPVAVTIQKGWIVICHHEGGESKYRPSEVVKNTERLAARPEYKEKNIMGEMVAPKGLTFKFEEPHLTIFRDGKFAGMVVPNGWSGKSKLINYPIADPVLTNYRGELSLGEMETILKEWKNNHLTL